MKLLKSVKILLLFYLLIAVLLPSYQGDGAAREFHFFEIYEPQSDYHHQGRTEIEASHDRDHFHTLLQYVPIQRIKRFNPDSRDTQLIITPAAETSINTAKQYIQVLSFPNIPAISFSKRVSGLSPPLG